ncbi:carbohydrate kinase family protein [Diaminobutyricibacter sp. McL0608]|uniref:carbohydrate kinase family protein n=1 Tax=Leifsonia sp. McL0608 TaxID=3143537 RepID=UPI0031F2D7C1
MLVVVGDLVEDIVVWRTGSLQEDTDNPAVITRAGGGSGANTAAAVAKDAPVRFIGRVGEDAIGVHLADALSGEGVDVRVQRSGRTGAIVILVDENGERTMFPDRGASVELSSIDESWFEGMTWLHFTFYGFESASSEQALLEASRLAHRCGVPISVDLSSVAVIHSLGRVKVLSLLDEVCPSVIFANRQEAQSVALRELAESLDVVCVIKQGVDPVLVLDSGKAELIPTVPVPNVKDTTGAGDAFSAGYLRAAVANLSAVDCALAGVKAAAEVLSHPGGRVLKNIEKIA